MASNLGNLGWFYRGKMEQATGVPESLDNKIVYFLFNTFAVTGFFVIALYTFQITRLMLSLFVLSGKPVQLILPSSASNSLMLVLATYIRSTLQNMGSDNWRIRWHREGIRSPTVSGRLFHRPRLSHCFKARCLGLRDQI